VTYF